MVFGLTFCLIFAMSTSGIVFTIVLQILVALILILVVLLRARLSVHIILRSRVYHGGPPAPPTYQHMRASQNNAWDLPKATGVHAICRV